MVAPKMKITYFHFDGLAEPVRFALAMTGEPWEDNRITSEQFEAIKAGLPNNQVPVLEVNGKVLPQSGAQLRFVGKRAGLYPDDPLEAAFADAAIDSVADSLARFTKYFYEEDKAKKAPIGRDIAENFLPRWLSNMEKSLKAAGGEYVTGNKLSIGDIALACRLEWIKKGHVEGVPTDMVDDYPLLSALFDRVYAEPRIASYREGVLAAKA